jgi:hypothetical protein
LLAAALLYGPLIGAAWASHAMACCAGDHCNIPRHRHQRAAEHPASSTAGGMDCGHDMSGVGMTGCSMSCCQDPDKPVVTAVAFVLPHAVFASTSILVARADDAPRFVEIPRSVDPLSPPPRVAAAAL